MPVAAVVAENDIVLAELAENTDRVGFLPQVGVGGAEEHALGEVFQHGFFEAADAVE